MTQLTGLARVCFESCECLPFLFDCKLGRKEDASSRIVVFVISPLVSLMSDQVSSFACHSVLLP